MDYLFTPWRYAYIAGADRATACLFCELAKPGDDAARYIVARAEHCLVVLNAFPYTNGHLMIAPYEHVDQLAKLPAPAAQEMMALSQRLESVLRDIYQPDGLNLGMNLGKAAGAGVAGHIHMHILPRWIADSNFMTTVGESRILPESLEQTYAKVKAKF
jgi:Diadenosine tetraphosphate (Ap4A) hydrolase and other HIT family hydrolases